MNCPHGVSSCPCNDGDPCNYEDWEGTKAMGPPEQLVIPNLYGDRMRIFEADVEDRETGRVKRCRISNLDDWALAVLDQGYEYKVGNITVYPGQIGTSLRPL